MIEDLLFIACQPVSPHPQLHLRQSLRRLFHRFAFLASQQHRAHRASFESAIDACMAHPNGLQDAGKLISRMKEVGHDLSMDHFNVLIRGFGDARNLGAALEVYREISGDSPRRSRSWGSFEVEEDTFAALLGACTRRCALICHLS